MRTDYQKLQRSLSKVVFGYVFLYININIGQVNLLPVFVGYLLFLSAIEGLKEEGTGAVSAEDARRDRWPCGMPWFGQ